MPVFPPAEAKSWGPIFAEEFAQTPAPYFGINIFDVPNQNWEATVKNVRQQIEMVKALGGQSYLWAVRDHGQKKRVLWINRYPQALKDLGNTIGEFVEGPIWKEFFELIDSFQWFMVSEQPSPEP
jgi:hypothetical protein